MSAWKVIVFGSLIVILGAGGVRGEDEPLFDALKGTVRSEAFSLGTLVQVVADYEADRARGTSGFSVANARFYVKGNLDRNLSYHVQASFVKPVAFLDVALKFQPREEWGTRVGAFKTPFSAEFLIPASNIDFVNRSLGVTLLGPGRQIGVQAQGRLLHGCMGYALGAFNGNGLVASGNDNNSLMTAGRLSYEVRETSRDRFISVGASALHSVDADAPVGFPIGGTAIARGFSGKRVLAGADVRAEAGRWTLASEGVWSRFDPTNSSRVEPWGYHATLGYVLTQKTQILARWDSLTARGVIDDSELALLGLNYWPTQPTEIQVNLIVETARSQPSPQLLVNFQLAF